MAFNEHGEASSPDSIVVKEIVKGLVDMSDERLLIKMERAHASLELVMEHQSEYSGGNYTVLDTLVTTRAGCVASSAACL